MFDDFDQVDLKGVTTIRHRIAVQKALDLINSQVHDPPTLFELASVAGLSRTYFSWVFKEVTGVRLKDYLTQMRQRKAMALLGDINLRIKQIAYETGFKDPNYFCRTFKKWTGQNPTMWRFEKFRSQGPSLEELPKKKPWEQKTAPSYNRTISAPL
jgi:YesN/AraC family two-component response regulator